MGVIIFAGGNAGIIAQQYALQENIRQKNKVEPAIYENTLYFMGPVQPVNIQEVLTRGYIQDGDNFLFSNDYPNTGVYTGPRRNTRDLLSSDKSHCYAIGYAVSGGAITIVELMTAQEMANNPNMKR
jgi:hypothetical protein